MSKDTSFKLKHFLLDILKPFKFLIFGQLTIGIIWAIDLSLRPYILKTIIDKIPHVTKDTVIEQLSSLVIFYVFMSLTVVVLFRIYDVIWLKLNPPIKRKIGDALMKKMMAHSVTVFQNQFAGDLANKIKEVMSGVPDLLRLLINHFFSHFLAFIIAIFTVWTIHYQFSILLASWIVIFSLGTAFFAKRARKLCSSAAEVRSSVIGHMVDILSNVFSIHLFSGKNTESKKLKRQLDAYVAADQKRDWWFVGMYSFQGLSFVVYQAIGFALLIMGFKDGIVTAGDFVLLISVNIAIVDCLWALSTDIAVLAELVGNITQGLRIALDPVDMKDKAGSKLLEVTQGKIEFDSVEFNYKGTSPIFSDKSVIIEAGQKIGLVGYSGGGKTTFVNLILRLYDVTDGRILIDGQNIREVTQDSLRNKIGMIPQDPSLFHRSLMDNIRYGRIDATDEEVIQAAKQAHAHEFILKLPQGYDALVGERGVKLSGGQRQRIAIARAILKNAPILILDEATSQLDSVTESYIQDSLWDLMQNKTTLVVAHRLSTLLHMDRIFVFDHGKIVQDGTHEALLVEGGLYKTLWAAQVGGFLLDKEDQNPELVGQITK